VVVRKGLESRVRAKELLVDGPGKVEVWVVTDLIREAVGENDLGSHIGEDLEGAGELLQTLVDNGLARLAPDFSCPFKATPSLALNAQGGESRVQAGSEGGDLPCYDGKEEGGREVDGITDQDIL
jgi:hypothetical protein